YQHHGKNIPLWSAVVTAPDGQHYQVSTVEFGDEETTTVVDVLPSGERVKQIHHLDASIGAAHRAVVEGINEASIDMHVDVLPVWPGRHAHHLHDELERIIHQRVHPSSTDSTGRTGELCTVVLDLVMLLTNPHPHFDERIRARDGSAPTRTDNPAGATT
ncbi:MAG: hypothetical protein ACRC0L_12085, partial [Angustibacter sp.]